MDMLSGSPNKVKTLITDKRFKVILSIQAVATKKTQLSLAGSL